MAFYKQMRGWQPIAAFLVSVCLLLQATLHVLAFHNILVHYPFFSLLHSPHLKYIARRRTQLVTFHSGHSSPPEEDFILAFTLDVVINTSNVRELIHGVLGTQLEPIDVTIISYNKVIPS